MALAVYALVVLMSAAAYGQEGGGGEGGGHYGGGHYGGGHYGGGGGHYAIGFSDAEIGKMCRNNTACQTCFLDSQTIDDKTRTLKMEDNQNCVKQYLQDNAWVGTCTAYADRILKSDAAAANENQQHMYSFCLRTGTEFYDSESCDSTKSWRDYMRCFSVSNH